MTAREFLKTDKRISAKSMAAAMWPNNKHANTYLSKKLNGVFEWTEADELAALNALADLKVSIPNAPAKTRYKKSAKKP